MDARVKPGHDKSIAPWHLSRPAQWVNSTPADFTLSPHNFHALAESCAQNMRGENSVGESGMYLWAVVRAIRAVLTHRRYRPELHYMRGPGPKWFERHGR
jgi:hypothetical protein